VHQLLREYEILGEILEAFVGEETSQLAAPPSPIDCLEVFRRLTRASRTLMRTTIDTFVSEYTSALEERNDRIQRFNRFASHELRSPIGTLMFAGSLLGMDNVLSDPQHVAKVASTVRSNTERLSRLLDNLQRLTRLTDILDLPNRQQIDLVVAAEEVARQLEDMAISKGVRIRVAVGPHSLTVDAARLELILLNLVSNAIKYSDPAKLERFVEISSARDADAGRHTIVVKDNGIGIAESDLRLVFERFFRAHADRDAELGISGTGLGLAIVADCLDALGGSITSESTPGVGTTFFVVLPETHPTISNQSI
jgi:signal transduction histidine kinase